MIIVASMGEEEKKKDDEYKGEKMVHEGWNDIREKKRSCTDVLILLLLLAVWGAMTLLGFVALGWIANDNLPAGNPNRLLSPMDYNGRICGYDASVASRRYGYYLLDSTAVCVSSCPTATDMTVFICKDEFQAAADADTTGITGASYVAQNLCMIQIKTRETLYRCYPDTADDDAIASSSSDASGITVNTPGWFTTFLQDLYENSGIIFGIGIGVSVVISFGYLFLLRIPGTLFIIIWTLLISILLAIFVGAYLLYALSVEWANEIPKTHDQNQIDAMTYVSYGVFAIGGLYLCLLLVMRERVQLAINVVKEASRALSAMPALLGVPAVQATGLVLFLVPWTIYSLFLASSGDIVLVTAQDTAGNSYTYRTFEYSENTQYAFLYMLFCWFWTSQFIIAYGQMTVALSFVAWYFTHAKDQVGTGTVVWAFQTVFFYHMGTVAFGSLVIAIIKTIRAVIAYIQKKAASSGNQLLVILMSCCQCCMWCLEKCMKFLNKNAYIQTAIYGYSFCWAAKQAFFLILRNIMRVFAVSMVGDFVLLLGKLFISVFTTFIAYLALTSNANNVNGFILPMLFVFVLSYFVSSMFTEIFGMGIETILMCFIADEEMFEPEKRFAEGGLRSTMQITAQQAAAAKIAPEVTEKMNEDGTGSASAESGTEKSTVSAAPAPAARVAAQEDEGESLL